MTLDLETIARIRQEKAGEKYLLPDGTNQAMFRDNGLDILEELADALNIAELWRQRIKASPDVGGWVRVDHRLLSLQGALLQAAFWVDALRADLPEEFRHDLIPVERVCGIEDNEHER